jgi:hypothetical protein
LPVYLKVTKFSEDGRKILKENYGIETRMIFRIKT